MKDKILLIIGLTIGVLILAVWFVIDMPQDCHSYQEKWIDGCITKSEYLPRSK
jgi:hypothetical protein